MSMKKNVILLIFTICLFNLTGCTRMQYNNSADKDALITKTYSSEDIAELRETNSISRVNLKQFKRLFKVECARKTHQGMYVVLSVDDKNAFVFFDQESFVRDIIVLDRFITKEVFENQVVVGQTTCEMVASFDPSTTYVPVSRAIISVHIVQEGAFVIEYLREKGSTNADEAVVESITFYSNQDILNPADDFVRAMIPCVLELDKKENQEN